MEYWAFSIGEAMPGQSHAQALDDLVTRVQTADRSGLDGWFFGEHHSDAGYSLIPSPNLLVATVAPTTERLRLGTMATILPYHHPLRVAEEIRLLDALSGGRIEIGLGRGGTPHERQAWGLAAEEVGDVFDAGCELLLRLLGEERIDYETAWWRGRSVAVVPEATQSPHPPLWLTAVSDRSIERSAQMGLHCAASFSYLEMLQARLDRYREAWEEHRPGQPPGKFSALALVVVAETEREAVRHGKEAMLARLNHFVRVFSVASRRAGQDPNRSTFSSRVSAMSFPELLHEGVVVFGSVDQCVEQLDRLRQTGIDVLVCSQVGGIDHDFADAALRLLGEEVIPKVEQARRAW